MGDRLSEERLQEIRWRVETKTVRWGDTAALLHDRDELAREAARLRATVDEREKNLDAALESERQLRAELARERAAHEATRGRLRVAREALEDIRRSEAVVPPVAREHAARALAETGGNDK